MNRAAQTSAVNIQAIAEAAGVSKTTVSHVLSGKRPVAAATKERVLKIMEEFGYRPNFFAQALVTQRSQTIALITQDITNPFYPSVARGVQQAATEGGRIVMLFDLGIDPARLRGFVDLATQRRIDGVIAAANGLDAAMLGTLESAGIPVVSIGPMPAGVAVDWVSADDQAIVEDAVRYLHAKGHERIGFIGGVSTVMPGSGRRQGYRRAMQALGLRSPPALQIDGNWARDGAAAATGRMLDLPSPPTAIVCANDIMAIGALDAAFARGLSVPGDLAIVGVDDIDAASLVRPSLTTVRIPAEEIGRAAAMLLLRRLSDRQGPRQHISIPHALVARDSA